MELFDVIAIHTRSALFGRYRMNIDTSRTKTSKIFEAGGDFAHFDLLGAEDAMKRCVEGCNAGSALDITTAREENA